MPPSEQIRARATVMVPLGSGAYRLKLANGHLCVGRAGKKDAADYQAGDSVTIEFHPYDLSRGYLVASSSV